MRWFLVATGILASAAARGAPVEPEGAPAFITGGSPTEELFPQMVQLRTESTSCSGSVIDPNGLWVLTAGSCLPETVGLDGVTAWTGANADELAIRSVRWLRHDSLDIAVVELAAPVRVPALTLNDEAMGSDWVGLNVSIVGFGATTRGAEDGGQRRVGESEISSTSKHDFTVYNGSVGLCDGDLGAPIIVYTGAGYVQVGVGVSGSDPCGQEPDTAIRTDVLMGWLAARGVAFHTQGPIDPPGTWECSIMGDESTPFSGTAYAVPPVDVSCALPVGFESFDPFWHWGDGATDPIEDPRPTVHTYTGMGEFKIGLCVSVNATSGPGQHCVSRDVLITCPQPDASFEVRVDGSTVRIEADAHDRCVTGDRWQVLDADGQEIATSTRAEPEFQIDLEGDYRVVRTVESQVGEFVEERSVVVAKSGGCSSLPLSATPWLVLLGLVGLGRRRRLG